MNPHSSQQNKAMMNKPSKSEIETDSADNKKRKEGRGLRPVDSLLHCLVYLTTHYGRARSAEAIISGLPYDEKGMGPDLFCDAAARLGLDTKIVKKAAFSQIHEDVLPCVLITGKDKACVLLSRDRLFDPEKGRVISVTEKELKGLFTGYAIYVHMSTSFADPAAQENDWKLDIGKHWFWGPFWKNKGIYARVVLASFLINLFGLVSPIYIMTVYDRVIPSSSIETGWVLGLGALTIFVFDFIIRTLRGYFIDFAGRRIDVSAASRVYDQLLNMRLSERPASSGSFANMLRDFDSVRDFMTSATITGLVDLPFSLFFITVVYWIGGGVALIILLLIGIVVTAGVLLQIPLKTSVRKTMTSAEVKHGLLVETIHGLETIKAIGADRRMRARYGHHVGESALLSQRTRFISAMAANIATFCQQSTSIIIVLMGMYLVRDGSLSTGGLIACVILSGRALSPVGQVANLISRFHQAKRSLKMLADFMDKPVERPDGKQFLHRPDLKGKLCLNNVSFSYPGIDRKVLDGVSFNIQAGEKVGIIGRIGSGKSTIARLMMGLYEPDEGTILADDTDYRQLDPADLRRHMAYIAQDVVLFRGTVRDNITASLPQATEEEILAAAKAAGVHDFISSHPMGYDAPVGERGEGLSGGQRQAVALARAMLLKPEVYICDEPTNAMDVQAEEAFLRHIRKEVQDRTLILITHRTSLLQLVDRLIMVEGGKIAIDGPRDQVLLKLSGQSGSGGGATP